MNTSDPARKKRGAGRRAGVRGWDEGQVKKIVFKSENLFSQN